MKLGVMQPYFFPYIGYFELINRTDQWIVFDQVQYIRHGWMNRNRILHANRQDWAYVTAPLQHHTYDTKIADVMVIPGLQWKERVVRQLDHYRKHAPYFGETVEVVKRSLDTEDASLSRVNVAGLSAFCDYLDIPFDYRFHSELSLNLGPVEGPGDWALRISEALGADEYVNPPGGGDLFVPQKFRDAGIKLTIQSPSNLTYKTGPYEFHPNLSIIDVCMWNSPLEIKNYLDSFPDMEMVA